MKLYHYWRSTSSWRVRWTLIHKKIPCEFVHISLLDGEAEKPEHLKRHPLGFVPVLELDSGETLIESLAIIQYLEMKYPSPALLPSDPLEKARALALAEVINSGTHPLQNPTVTAFLGEAFQATPEQQTMWSQTWIAKGLELFEKLLPESVLTSAEPFAVGHSLTIADVCLMPQLYNATRYGVKLDAFPKIQTIQKYLANLESYQKSHPDRFQA